MEETEYFELLEYLKGKVGRNKDYKQWASQFKEKNNHIYYNEK